jgi:FKBP-type peptidyl-prolyl cis-trans isomerase FkpA
MKNIKNILLALTGAALFTTANAQDVTMQTTPKGLKYHIFTSSTNPKIKLSDVITFNVAQKTDKDSLLFSTYAAGKPVKIQVQPSQNIGDLMEVFPLLCAGDSALVKVPTDSIFVGHEEQRPPFLPKGSGLVFVMKIEKVQSLDEAMAERNAAMEKLKAEAAKMKDAEAANRQKYIADHNLVVKTTPSGLNYVVTAATLKRKPLKGDTVFVNYAGRTLEGKLFDTSIETLAKASGINQPGRPYEPLSFVLGEGHVIKGWDEGLALLNEGSKATLIIPSAIAYGEQGAGADIKPYSTLVFDVELVKVSPGKHPVVKKPIAKKKGTATTTKKVVKKTTAIKK